MTRWLQRASAAMVGIGILAVTSRRWSAPLLASALGMGLFIGVAFGPAIDGSNASGSQLLTLDGGTSAQTASQPAPASDGSTDASSSTPSDSTTQPAPYVPPATAPYVPPAPLPAPAPVEPPADPPASDPTDPGNGDGGGDTSESAGTVVHVNPIAGSYTLAVRGELYGVHAGDLPDPGQKVAVALTTLANGTYAEDGDRTESGTTDSGTLNGFVTWVSPEGAAPAYTLSMRGTSVPITLPEGATADQLPKVGQFVEADVSIEDPPAGTAQRMRRAAASAAAAAAPAAPSCARQDPVEPVAAEELLVQQSQQPTGDEFDYFDLAGSVQAACPDLHQLVISADDIRAAGADIVLTVPAKISLAKVKVDSPVLATAEMGDDGSLTLAGLGSDDGADGANDEELLQGDLGG